MSNRFEKYKPFDGDGRTVRQITGKSDYPGNPAPIRNSAARMLIGEFDRNGLSTHSRGCTTLWVILEWCHVNKQGYTLEFKPDYGAVVYSGRKPDYIVSMFE